MTVASCRDTLYKISRRMTADAFFAIRDFCDGLYRLGFTLISRFRDNACMRYLHRPDPFEVPYKERPQQFEDKVDILSPDMSVFREFHRLGEAGHYLTVILNSWGLHRDVVIVIYYPPKGVPKIYFSTDTTLSGEMVTEFYRLRFQIEFCIRDAK